MANNYLEQLIAEWYEYRGYYIRRNVKVGKLERGGYSDELDLVGFNPSRSHLIHVEPAMCALHTLVTGKELKPIWDREA
jgi:hypothetical protein